MLRALEQIRRMRGGAQSHLMHCSDGHYYVVKFQNNPQHSRVLVNELLGTKLAARLGLPTTPVAVVEVSEELIRLTPELCVELPRSRIPCQPGLQFGSRFPGDPRRMTLHDFLPDEQLRAVANLHEFAGMLVFDKWTCNTNGRQTLFYVRADWSANDRPAGGPAPHSAPPPAVLGEIGLAGDPAEARELVYETRMIDQGFCFNAGEWTFPDAPLRGLYTRNRVYQGVTGMESFAPWLTRLEKGLGEKVLDELSREIPPQWYADDYDALLRLLEQLHRRRSRVEELILGAKKSSRQPFPNWV
ncbi:MAG TPA: HipA family kinase [Candidatus Acidoferrum sp.]|nr:HipA family kinase [Candidatus Acidoferrum sp.]